MTAITKITIISDFGLSCFKNYFILRGLALVRVRQAHPDKASVIISFYGVLHIDGGKMKKMSCFSNLNHGSQFTCYGYVYYLKNEGIQISMDGKGRGVDNIFIEKFDEL